MAHILSVTGEPFDYDNPRHVDIEEIAHALSHICRFGGHTSEFYSVAQHSIMVSSILPSSLALEGLLHDASEAFIGDMPTPLKLMFPGYKEIERRIEAVMSEQYGLNLAAPEIKQADLLMLATERKLFTKNQEDYWPILEGIEPLPWVFPPMSPEKAKDAFLNVYQEINNGLSCDS